MSAVFALPRGERSFSVEGEVSTRVGDDVARVAKKKVVRVEARMVSVLRKRKNSRLGAIDEFELISKLLQSIYTRLYW